MLHGFGLAPVSLQIDLDSYDGPWTHMHRFRGRSGWLVVAEARVTSGAASWETTLVAACDEWGAAVPGFMAPNLLGCACSLPQPCCEHPPDERDSWVEEEEGALVARWLRATNADLAALHDAAAHRIEAGEARVAAFVRAGERQIAELRRRRRRTLPGDPARDAVDGVIAAIEAEGDDALARLARRRAEWRAEAEAAEERLLTTTAVSVEVTPLYQVNWHACVERDAVQREWGSEAFWDRLRDGGHAGLRDLRSPARWLYADVIDAASLRRDLAALDIQLKQARKRQEKLDGGARVALARFPNWAPQVRMAEQDRRLGREALDELEAAHADLVRRLAEME